MNRRSRRHRTLAAGVVLSPLAPKRSGVRHPNLLLPPRRRRRNNQPVLPIRIRRARDDDYPTLQALRAELDAGYRAMLPECLPAPAAEWFPVTGPAQDSLLLIAEADSRVLGMLSARIIEAPVLNLTRPRRYVTVDSLVVSQSCRRQGIGRALMAELYRWADEHQVSQVEVTVYDFNRPALSFFTQLGYRTVSRRLHRTVPPPA